ncbi:MULTISPECIES: BrnT family toxin [unclassified Tychonema]|uniref:BrnT family toxin n=1 Tax=unclassified Tychonema TaxID=2642144 RepID=UPI001D13F6D1|nr:MULTISPECIES: BrnT family toxin [unclassified Tychonema]
MSKHENSFEQARTVFDDRLYVDFYDSDRSDEKDRYIIVGESQQGNLLIVSYTWGGDKEVYEIDCIRVAARIPC